MKWVETIFRNNKTKFEALRNMFAFFAVTHITIATLLVIKNQDLSYLNVFYIASVSDFLPGIENGAASFIISFIIIASVYLYFYIRSSKKNKS